MQVTPSRSENIDAHKLLMLFTAYFGGVFQRPRSLLTVTSLKFKVFIHRYLMWMSQAQHAHDTCCECVHADMSCHKFHMEPPPRTLHPGHVKLLWEQRCKRLMDRGECAYLRQSMLYCTAFDPVVLGLSSPSYQQLFYCTALCMSPHITHQQPSREPCYAGLAHL